MGLVYGILRQNGQPLVGVVLNFWKDGSIQASDTTGGTGDYSVTLMVPGTYRAMTGGKECLESPVNVPAGPLNQDLTKP